MTSSWLTPPSPRPKRCRPGYASANVCCAATIARGVRSAMRAIPLATTMWLVAANNTAAWVKASRPATSGIQMAPYPSASSSATFLAHLCHRLPVEVEGPNTDFSKYDVHLLLLMNRPFPISCGRISFVLICGESEFVTIVRS